MGLFSSYVRVLLVLLVAGGLPPLAHADPQISCANPMFDFGSRQWGDTIELSYTIKNDDATYLSPLLYPESLKISPGGRKAKIDWAPLDVESQKSVHQQNNRALCPQLQTL